MEKGSIKMVGLLLGFYGGKGFQIMQKSLPELPHRLISL